MNEPSARTLVAGDLEAVFWPGRGMLGASLRHRGTELLGRVEDLEGAAARRSTAGIPLLHPWANRLASPRYRALGRDVILDPSSPLLHCDEHGLPMHGVPWPLLSWEIVEVAPHRLRAQLEWMRGDLMAVFPFPHRLELVATLASDTLTLETTLAAGPDSPVPVSFGFHPYFTFSELPRGQWQMELPALRRLVLDRQGIPTGGEEVFGGFEGPLGDLHFDDGFAVLDEQPTFAVFGSDRRITVEFGSGYPYAQVFAPKDKAFIALEPMTAPTNALASGRGLHVAHPGGHYRAVFRIRVEALAPKMQETR
jgi:galactose mutarotase-like enzyme